MVLQVVPRCPRGLPLPHADGGERPSREQTKHSRGRPLGTRYAVCRRPATAAASPQRQRARRSRMACRGTPGQRSRSENVARLGVDSPVSGAWPTAPAIGVVMPASRRAVFYLSSLLFGVRSEKRGMRQRARSSVFPFAWLSSTHNTTQGKRGVDAQVTRQSRPLCRSPVSFLLRPPFRSSFFCQSPSAGGGIRRNQLLSYVQYFVCQMLS
jgi:hypothetical protein